MTSSDSRLTNVMSSGGLWEMTRRVQVVTFTGAGGKTTCLRSLTHELESAGLQVIATTTTKVFPEEHMKVWESDDPPKEPGVACFWYVKSEEISGKWIGPSVPAVDAAIEEDLLSLEGNYRQAEEPRGIVSAWVIEGDGARGLSLKCWDPHEPQIPLRSNCAVLVLDRGLWGKVLRSNQVHRPQRCSDLLGHVWKAESAWRYFLKSPVFAAQYGNLAWVILLNGPRGVAKTMDQMINQGSGEDIDLLQELSQKWVDIQAEADKLKHRPIHLRLAVGDAKEGKIQWCDLW